MNAAAGLSDVKKRLLIYGLVVLGLTTAGIVASVVYFGEEAVAVLPGPALRAPRAPSSGARPVARIPPTATTENPGADPGVKVVALEGSAQRARGAEQAWTDLSVGVALEKDDRVQTGAGARVTLGVGAGSKLEIADRAELRVGASTSSNRTFKLVRGRIAVEYKESGRKLRIESADGSAAAETEEGVFAVLSTGTAVAVATKTGSVDLSTGGTAVAVRAGEQSVAAGGAVSRPRTIPLDVLLKVVDPGCRVQREAFIVLSGRTAPGAAVRANGAQADIDAQGRFSVRVPLRVGKNDILVVTEDVAGHRKTKKFPCITVDPGAPIKKIDIKWGPSDGEGTS